MSMELERMIDKENLEIDCLNLQKFIDKHSLHEKIDEIKLDFISDEEMIKELDSLTLIFKFAEEIKNILW